MQIFKQKVASAHLMTHRRTKRGDVVAVVGSSPTLGAWDPARGVVATEFPPRSGNWSVTVFYDAGTLQEWNWVIICEETREVSHGVCVCVCVCVSVRVFACVCDFRYNGTNWSREKFLLRNEILKTVSFQSTATKTKNNINSNNKACTYFRC